MLKPCKKITGSKIIKLIGGPGNDMILIVSGKFSLLQYEVKGKTYYYKSNGLSDGKHELFSLLGEELQKNKQTVFDNINSSFPTYNNTKIGDKLVLLK